MGTEGGKGKGWGVGESPVSQSLSTLGSEPYPPSLTPCSLHTGQTIPMSGSSGSLLFLEHNVFLSLGGAGKWAASPWVALSPAGFVWPHGVVTPW